MKTKHLILTMVLLFISMPLLAQENEPLTSATIVQWLTPIIVYCVTWLVRKVMQFIPGWATLFLVSALSTAVAWITTTLQSAHLSFLEQTLYRLLAVVIHQFYKQFTSK